MTQTLSEPSTEANLPAARRTWYTVLFYWILTVGILVGAAFFPALYLQRYQRLVPEDAEQWMILVAAVMGPLIHLSLARVTIKLARGNLPIRPLGKARNWAIANGLMTGIGCAAVGLVLLLQPDQLSVERCWFLLACLLGSVGGWCLVLRAWDERRQERQARELTGPGQQANQPK